MKITSIPTQDITFILPSDGTGLRTLVTMAKFTLTRDAVAIEWNKQKIDADGNVIVNENIKPSLERITGGNNVIVDQSTMAEVGVLTNDGRIRTKTDITYGFDENGKPVTTDNSTYLVPDGNGDYDYPNPLAKMLEFFWYVANNVPVKVADILRQFGAAKYGGQ